MAGKKRLARGGAFADIQAFRRNTMCPIDGGRTGWLSGEVCVLSAKYRSEGCRHRQEREFAENDIFTHCPTCRKELQWTPVSASPE